MAYDALDYDRLAALQGRIADRDLDAVDELAAYVKTTDSELWALVGGMLTATSSTTIDRWKAEALASFTGLERARVRYFHGCFTLICDAWRETYDGHPCLRDVHALYLRADELCFSAGQADASFKRFCANEFTRNLTSLSWHGSGLSQYFGDAFISTDFSNLRTLSFYWEGLRPSGIANLFENGTLDNLRALNVDFCGPEREEVWTPYHLAGLDQAVFAGTLETLMMSACEMTTEALHSLLENRQLMAGLKRLEFGFETLHETFNIFEDEGARLISQCPELSQLDYLSVRGCLMEDSAISILIDSPHLPSTMTLDAGSEFSDAALDAAEERFDHVVRHD